MNDISNASKREILRMETMAKFPFLIEIEYTDSSGSAQTFNYANSDDDITFKGKIYSASYFKISPPEKTEDSVGNASIQISCIDQEWIDRIRSTQSRAKIKIMACIVRDVNGSVSVEAIDELDFTLTNASWNEYAITWTMEFDDIMEYSVPPDLGSFTITPAVGDY